MKLESYALGNWQAGEGRWVQLLNAVNGDLVAESSSAGLNFGGMLDYARDTGGPALRSSGAMVRSEDFREGPRAFVEKRPPRWQGK